MFHFENAESRIAVSVLPEDIVSWYRTGFVYSRRTSEPLFGLIQYPQGRSEDRGRLASLSKPSELAGGFQSVFTRLEQQKSAIDRALSALRERRSPVLWPVSPGR